MHFGNANAEELITTTRSQTSFACREETIMLKHVASALALLAVVAFAPSPARAGSPHFVFIDIARDGNALEISGKEAGLGNETQVHIVLSATAACINPGGNHPKAANKESITAEGDFPVQNGKALFQLSAEAHFQPECSPPMSVEFTDVIVCDTSHNICVSFTGTF